MPWSGFAAGALGAVGSLIGGGISASNARDQMAQQREFAQNGIRWKVADAKAAGIHPLAALGAQTFSYNPVIVGDGGISEALGRMGQGIDRAAEAKAAQAEREANDVVRGLQIEGLKLDNQRKQQQIDADYTRQAYELADRIAAKQQQVPPMPVVNDGGKGGPSSTTPGINPFWDHFRNFAWITNVPAGDLKDYAGENMLVNIASQLAYADSAWRGKVRPDRSVYTDEERSKIASGFYSPFFYPFMGWRVEPNYKRYLSRAMPFLTPALMQWWANKRR